MENGGGGGLAGLLFMVVWLGIVVFLVASMWKVFAKAGRPGWAAIVPIYNAIVMLRIIGRPAWWILLFIVPILNVVIAIMVGIELAKAFGKGTGFGLGLIFLGFIFYPILGFGSARYQGPVAGA